MMIRLSCRSRCYRANFISEFEKELNRPNTIYLVDGKPPEIYRAMTILVSCPKDAVIGVSLSVK